MYGPLKDTDSDALVACALQLRFRNLVTYRGNTVICLRRCAATALRSGSCLSHALI